MNGIENDSLEKKLTMIVKEAKPSFYKLKIFSVIQGWYGGLGYQELSKTVSPEQLDGIRKDPLQDYGKFGAQTVVLVDIDMIPFYDIGEYRVEGKVGNLFAECENKHLAKEAEKIWDKYINDEFDAAIANTEINKGDE
jgi:hypothetical protein